MPGPSVRFVLPLALAAVIEVACTTGPDAGNSPPPPSTSFASNPCTPSGTVNLPTAGSTVLDCAAGQTTVTLAANGASYLIVPQFATNLVTNQLVPYSLASGTIASAARVPVGMDRADRAVVMTLHDGPGAAQARFEATLASRTWGPVTAASLLPPQRRGWALMTPPTIGSARTFHVLSNASTRLDSHARGDEGT